MPNVRTHTRIYAMGMSGDRGLNDGGVNKSTCVCVYGRPRGGEILSTAVATVVGIIPPKPDNNDVFGVLRIFGRARAGERVSESEFIFSCDPCHMSLAP